MTLEEAIREYQEDGYEVTHVVDSDEFWDADDAEECACTCGGEQFAAALGLSCRPDGEVRWVTVGLRCLACGLCGVYEDWKIDYMPSRHLLTRA